MRKKAFFLLLLAAPIFLSASAHADERPFAYVYEAEVLPPGAVEFEQWITNRNGKAEGVYSAFDLREEIEFGISPRLTTAVYLNAKSGYSSIYDPLSGSDVTSEEFHFEGISSEWKYLLLSPHAHWLGVLAYAEFGYNGPEFEAEAKLVLEHRFSDELIWALNLVGENEYAFEASRQSLENKLEITTGLSYEVSPGLSLAVEARNHRVRPDAGSPEEFSAWYLGPTLHVAKDKWWATLSVLPQLAGMPETSSGDGRELVEHEKVETRLLVGLNF